MARLLTARACSRAIAAAVRRPAGPSMAGRRLLSAAAMRSPQTLAAAAAPRTVSVQRTAWTSASRGYASEPPEGAMVVPMPALSPTMTTGTLQQWNVKIGDEVAAGDSLADVETDKATMSMDSTEDGFIANILVPDGAADIPVGQPIIVMCEEEGQIADVAKFVPAAGAAAEAAPEPAPAPTPAAAPAPAAAAPAATAPTPAAAPAASGDRVKASPLAKRLAAAANVALASVPGSGPGGRITKADVDAFAAAPPAAAPAAAAAPSADGQFTDTPLTNMRKVIASRLLESKQNIPHYYLSIDVKVDEAMTLRKQFNDAANGEYKVSMNDFVIKASSLALKKVPAVNSSWMDTFVREHHNVDISVAVSTPNGLITPIVFNSDRKGLASISADVKDLATRARDNKLAPHEFQGGTFTISNLGMFGVKNFSAIINPPQACILAVGTTEKQVVPDESTETGLGVASVMSVTLSCDHRVVDGAVGAQWLSAFKAYLENPTTMLL